MDTPSSSLQVPRLRVSRTGYSPPHVNGDSDDLNTPIAGPSRLMNLDVEKDDDEDMQSTPRMGVTGSIAVEAPTHAESPLEQTLGTRLRTLLARSHERRLQDESVPVLQSDHESDFELPRHSPSTPSVAHESLKGLFSHALRDPGDTPQKDGEKEKPRRNSVDGSEVEASPRVQRDRDTYKGKRRSLSDEEVEKASKADRASEASFRSSQAVAYDMLRQRLINSRGKSQEMSGDFIGDESVSSIQGEGQPDIFSQDANHLPGTPPAATSTPQRSLNLPSQLQFDSNLLEQDSEMQKELKGLDSYDDDLNSQPRPAFPPARISSSHMPFLNREAGQLRSSPPSKTPFGDKTRTPGFSQSRRSSAEFDRNSSRASSSLSNVDGKDFQPDLMHEREREWNRRHPKPSPTPRLEHRHSHTRSSDGSPSASAVKFPNGASQSLSRRTSIASLSDLSSRSRTSSVSSQAEYRERIREIDQERNVERERGWNKPRSRPSSSLSVHTPHSPTHVRTRAHSHSSHLNSPATLLDPDAGRFNGRGSRSPLPSSRSVSPNGSINSSKGSLKEEIGEIKQVVTHERERNWNSPHPKWQQRSSYHGSSSTLSVAGTESGPTRVRAESLKSPAERIKQRRPLAPSTSHSSLHGSDQSSTHSTDPSQSRTVPSQPPNQSSQRMRPTSSRSPPAADDVSNVNGEGKTSTLAAGRSGWSLPRYRAQLPPLELENPPDQRGFPASSARGPEPPSPSPLSSRPSSRTSEHSYPSHIPVRTPFKALEVNVSSGQNGHVHVDDAESQASLKPHNEVHQTRPQDTLFPSDEESPSPMSTPIARPSLSLAEEGLDQRIRRSPPKDIARVDDETAGVPPTDSPDPPSIPLPTPPADFPYRDNPVYSLATPPRQLSISASKLEFKTPSPPKNLPELPDPPSESEEDTARGLGVGHLTFGMTPRPPGAWANTPIHNVVESPSEVPAIHETEVNDIGRLGLSISKTPRAPGAWSDTPVADRREGLIRADSLPEELESSKSEGGLVTPAPSLSRAHTLPSQTPAPPGGWAATTNSSRRKSILKVRFDTEAAQSHAVSPEQSLPENQDTSLSAPSHAEEKFWTGQKIPSGTSRPENETSSAHVLDQSTQASSRQTSPRSSRKSPAIRVVDAFGRECSEPADTQSGGNGHGAGFGSPLKNNAIVKIVDAMGREVEESPVEESSHADEDAKIEEDTPMTRHDTLAQMRRTLSELSDGLNEADRSRDELEPDNARLRELEKASQASRDMRAKLKETLHMVQQSSKRDLKSRFGLLRDSMSRRKSKLLHFTPTDRALWSFGTSSRTFWAVIVLQFFLIVYLYRVAMSQARHIFLTTFYDPLNPNLHLHITHPDVLRYMSSIAVNEHATSSTPSIYSILNQKDWKSVVFVLWKFFASIVRDGQVWIWRTWGEEQGGRLTSWPPT